MDKDVLHKELDKARKRLADQGKALLNAQEIVRSDLALPSLKTIAKKRIPKLQEEHDLSVKVVKELEDALNDPAPTQVHIEDVTSSPTQPRKRAQ